MSANDKQSLGTVLQFPEQQLVIKSLSEGEHTFRELTLQALAMQVYVDGVKQATSSMAAHYHALCVKVEQAVVERMADKDWDEQCAAVILAVDGYVQAEIDWLKQEKGWSAGRLPTAADAALRKITNALRLGGSLRELQTVSQCEKFVRETNKKVAQAAKAELEKELGLSGAGGKSEGKGGEGVSVAASLDLPEEAAQLLASFVKQFEDCYKLDSKVATDMVTATTAKMRKHVDHVTRNVVRMAAGK